MKVTLWSKTPIYTTKELEDIVEERCKTKDNETNLFFSDDYSAYDTEEMWYALTGTEEERKKYIKKMKIRIKEFIREEVFYDLKKTTINIEEEEKI